MGLWGTFLVLLLLTMLGYMSYFPTLYIFHLEYLPS